MIAATTAFWKAFFDPENPKHSHAMSEILVFDKEKIIISEFVVAEVVSWLKEKGKKKQKDWFLDYALNTANTRVFHYGKEEFHRMAEISADSDLSLAEASVEYLRKELNCDVTGY